jgi:hypothetical protein
MAVGSLIPVDRRSTLDPSVRSGFSHLRDSGYSVWDNAPLMSNDYEYYNLANRNDERLIKKI